ncbi:hypothetical protein BIV60_20195 [Bacillus sp. MUM 116]|uniref:hypothetical protein n=1 Tax=Bacillus sp. MUM 116 TaxID=1678002 RepID=UPI0008F5EDB1|nr:hypothetical protein BIV60_20195 [Bacillus sp. MUM 116]
MTVKPEDNALGGVFSLRNDLPAKMAPLSKDIFTFSQDGGKMIKNGWMEEHPQIEDWIQLNFPYLLPSN